MKFITAYFGWPEFKTWYRSFEFWTELNMSLDEIQVDAINMNFRRNNTGIGLKQNY